MHSSRMRTVRCSGRLSCHACPLPATHAPTAMHVSLPCMTPPHTPPATYAPLPCIPPCHTCPPPPHMPPLPCSPPWTEFLTHACENITFPQLLLWTVIKIVDIERQEPYYLYPIDLLPPANEVCKGYVFTGVCLSTGGSIWAGTPPGRYPLAGTSPWQVHPPGRYTPLGRYSPWAGTPQAGTPPGRYPLAGTAPQADTPPVGRYTPLPGRYTPQAGTPPGRYTPSHSACWDTVNKRAVRIPLECILVITTRMHSSRMRTVRCSGRLACGQNS